MEIKGTPAPWKTGLGYEQEEVGFYIQDAQGRIILSADVMPLKLDMQLIEVAPDLLAALEMASEALEHSKPVASHYREAEYRHNNALEQVREAIARAKGGAA